MDIEQLRAYCLALPAVTEDLPFGPETLAFRVGGKIFALTGLDTPAPHRVNLKCAPDRVPQLREAYPTAILPGYHMNKQHWNTLVLDGQVPLVVVHELITHSYQLVAASLPRSTQAQLGIVTTQPSPTPKTKTHEPTAKQVTKPIKKKKKKATR